MSGYVRPRRDTGKLFSPFEEISLLPEGPEQPDLPHPAGVLQRQLRSTHGQGLPGLPAQETPNARGEQKGKLI